ncbi:DUF4956 domain-containing protein [Clostridium sp. UBA4548]|uniref:DUF4956 domain-containing protein n=1 Tax=Clostridium sp. UBA4548 TaxID=1946361 RepID=UPI0025C07F9A|nr:DUF4956 domain-containing protein [Clostridium sp. UBA4548]
MNNFSDIFKKGFLQETGNLTIGGFIMSMLAAFICGMIVYFVYRKFFKGVIYNNNFNILLVLTSMVTCFIVIVISSNVVLSLGMVGALSIVRYRTAVKDPLDVGFLFWTVAVGVTCGAGLYIISLLGTIFIAIIYILLVNVRSRKRVYIFIVKYENEAGKAVMREIEGINKVLKNKTTSKGYTELTYEVRLNGDNTAFVTTLSEIDGVENAVIVEFTGDYFE